jgi:hypothetical protein
MQTLFEVVNGDVSLAIEHNQVVSVALVISEKKILAVLGSIVLPVVSCYFDGWGFGMVV